MLPVRVTTSLELDGLKERKERSEEGVCWIAVGLCQGFTMEFWMEREPLQ